jgi:hypothetical protein
MAGPMSSSRKDRPPPPEPSSPGTFIDWGPALPESHGQTRITALPRDPEHFFAFWEGGTAVRARDLAGGPARELSVGRSGSGYFDGIPEHEYQVDLLLDGRVVAVSSRFRLPRRSPAAELDGEWLPTPDQLEILRRIAESLELQMREELEAANSEILRRRAGGGGRPSSSGRR